MTTPDSHRMAFVHIWAPQSGEAETLKALQNVTVRFCLLLLQNEENFVSVVDHRILEKARLEHRIQHHPYNLTLIRGFPPHLGPWLKAACNDSNDEAFPASCWVPAGSLWCGCGLRCATDAAAAAADGAVGTRGGGREACGSGGHKVGEVMKCVLNRHGFNQDQPRHDPGAHFFVAPKLICH